MKLAFGLCLGLLWAGCANAVQPVASFEVDNYKLGVWCGEQALVYTKNAKEDGGPGIWLASVQGDKRRITKESPGSAVACSRDGTVIFLSRSLPGYGGELHFVHAETGGTGQIYAGNDSWHERIETDPIGPVSDRIFVAGRQEAVSPHLAKLVPIPLPPQVQSGALLGVGWGLDGSAWMLTSSREHRKDAKLLYWPAGEAAPQELNLPQLNSVDFSGRIVWVPEIQAIYLIGWTDDQDGFERPDLYELKLFEPKGKPRVRRIAKDVDDHRSVRGGIVYLQKRIRSGGETTHPAMMFRNTSGKTEELVTSPRVVDGYRVSPSGRQVAAKVGSSKVLLFEIK